MLLSATVEHMKLQIKRREKLRKLAAEKGMGNAEFEKVYENEAKSLNECRDCWLLRRWWRWRWSWWETRGWGQQVKRTVSRAAEG